MRRLEHCNIVQLKYYFYSSGDKVIYIFLTTLEKKFAENTKKNIYIL